jgi:hypothetical protein
VIAAAVPPPAAITEAAPSASEASALPPAIYTPASISDAPGAGRGAAQGPGPLYGATGGSAQVSERDLDLPFYPGARQNPSDSQRMDEGGSGQWMAAGLRSGDELAKVVSFYRERLLSGSTRLTVQENAAGPGQWQLMVADPASGVNRSVLVLQDGDQVVIGLSRWQPPPPPPARGG